MCVVKLVSNYVSFAKYTSIKLDESNIKLLNIYYVTELYRNLDLQKIILKQRDTKCIQASIARLGIVVHITVI